MENVVQIETVVVMFAEPLMFVLNVFEVDWLALPVVVNLRVSIFVRHVVAFAV